MISRIFRKLHSTLSSSGEPRWFLMLNHNPHDPAVPDDVTLFGSLESLSGDLSPEDLATGQYLAVCSRGCIVTLRAAQDRETVEASLAEVASAEGRAIAFLKHYLSMASETRPTLGIDRNAVEREGDLARLAAIVPPRDIGA